MRSAGAGRKRKEESGDHHDDGALFEDDADALYGYGGTVPFEEPRAMM